LCSAASSECRDTTSHLENRIRRGFSVGIRWLRGTPLFDRCACHGEQLQDKVQALLMCTDADFVLCGESLLT